MYTYRARDLNQKTDANSLGLVVCGEDKGMQVQIQDSTNTNIRLLHERPDPRLAPEPELAALAKQVNDVLEPKAKQLLAAKRAAAANNKERVEFTVLLTDNGLQLAYVYGLEEKEVAPTPGKPWWRSLLGPLVVRRYWKMPTHHTTPSPVRSVRWPAFFWLLLLLAALGAGAYFALWSDGAGGVTKLFVP